MPHRPKKQFIDKKKSVTFQLVHRSQKDPLAADEDAPQRVLVPLEDKHLTSNKAISETPQEYDNRLSKQKNFGIDFEDDYDYMQHLKEPTKEDHTILIPKEDARVAIEIMEDDESGMVDVIKEDQSVLRLPSVVFGSKVEEDVGMLHRAIPPVGPQPSWDPDIVAGLEEDFDYDNLDNQLEDDFISKACAPSGFSFDGMEEGDEEYEDYDSDMDGSYFSDEKHDTKSCFTSYSMTSSVIRRNDHLTLLDDRFEKFVEAYDDTNIGDLCQVDIEGGMSVENIDEMEGLKRMLGIGDQSGPENNSRERTRAKLPSILEDYDAEGNLRDDENMISMIKEADHAKWDCESVLSTYSNIYNHPKLIEDPPKKIKVSIKSGIPIDTTPRLSKKELRLLDNTKPASDEISWARQKNETKEEKQMRKQAVKEAKRERRQEKKTTKQAFRQEESRQNKQLLNIRQNLSGIKIS